MPDQVSGPVDTYATSGPGSLHTGRWFVRTGYTVLFGAIAMAVVESVLAWGKTSPLSAIFGRDSPIAGTARELFGGIEITDADAIPASGFEESTVWGGKSSLQ